MLEDFDKAPHSGIPQIKITRNSIVLNKSAVGLLLLRHFFPPRIRILREPISKKIYISRTEKTCGYILHRYQGHNSYVLNSRPLCHNLAKELDGFRTYIINTERSTFNDMEVCYLIDAETPKNTHKGIEHNG